jgi:WD40 repeat protein
LRKSLLLLFVCQVSFGQQINFNAKGLLFLQDSDFNYYSGTSGQIVKSRNNIDKIGAVLFPLKYESAKEISEESVSNSVFYNQKAIAVRSDGRICYVLESKGGIKRDYLEAQNNVKDLPEGNYVSVVEISNLSKLKPDYRFPVGLNPTAISLSKDDQYLAVSSEAYNQELQVLELNEFGKPIRIISKPNLFGNGKISDITWHPSGDFLVYIKQETKEVGLIKVVRDGPTKKIVRLETHGNTLKMEGLPQSGQFTADGKYYLLLDKKQEINTKDNAKKGEVFVIKFNLEDQANHFLISKVEIQENPTAMAIHPEGNWVLVANAKGSSDYPVSIKSNQYSISVLNLNSGGNITTKATVDAEGMLPSSIVFDKNGQNAAVSIFENLNFGKNFGSIDFFKFNVSGSTPKLEKQSNRIFTETGIHYLKVIEDF